MLLFMLLFRLRNEKDEANDRADQLASQLKDVQDSLSQAENDRDDLHRKVRHQGVVLLSPRIVFSGLVLSDFFSNFVISFSSSRILKLASFRVFLL